MEKIFQAPPSESVNPLQDDLHDRIKALKEEMSFLLKAHMSLPELIENSERIFKGAFNSKL